MNWLDLVILAFILGFGIIGMHNGFILTVFKLGAFFISAYVSIKFYPVLAGLIMKTAIYTNIKAGIYKNLLISQQAQVPKVNSQVRQATADSIISNLHLPGFLKGTLESQIPDPARLVDINRILDTVSGLLAKVVIDVISLVLLYILIRIGLTFFRFILQSIAKLPLFKQIDKLGGFTLGALEGLLTIYIICAVLVIFNSNPSFKWLFDALDKSILTKFLYQNNFIIDLAISKGKPL